MHETNHDIKRRADDARKFSDQIALIAEMSRGFASSEDITATLGLGLTRIAEYMDAEAASLFMHDGEEGDLVCRACVGPVEITGLRIPAGKGIVGRTVATGNAEMVRDVQADPDFAKGIDSETGFTTRSILCAPMSVRETCLGAIELLNKRSGDHLFDLNDRSSLEVLASSAAMAIINARLSEKLIDQERVRRELELAAEIQRSLLPRPRGDEFPIHGINVPVYTVSGDFFDIMELDDGRVWFAVGDVSGKGMNASLMMTKTVSLFRCLGKSIHQPGRLLAAINSELCETGSHGMFVTMVGGLLDRRRGRVVLANAGHEPPLLSKDGEFFEFEAEAPPLGVLDGLEPVPETTIDLEGGALYIFTDGLTEAEKPGEGMLGGEGVRTLIRGHDGLLGVGRLSSIVKTVMEMGGPQRDDLTIMVIDGGLTKEGEIPTEETHGRHLLHLRVPATPDQLKPVRVAVTKAMRGTGSDEFWVQDLVLAIDEACQNIIRHAYKEKGDGDFEIDLWHHGGTVETRLTDFGPPVDAAVIKPRDLDDLRPGGLGTHFINEVMDEVIYERLPEGGGNLLRMIKKTE